MNAWCRRVADSREVQRLIMILILLNAVVLGLETVPSIYDVYSKAFRITQWVIQSLFVLEILVRFGAAPSPLRFFRDGWNIFDTIVVTAGLIPAVGRTVTIARLARVLRIARLIEVSDEMKLIVATIAQSMKSLSKLILLILVLIYSYAIVGYHLFSDDDPENWGSLGRSMWTLFQNMTLEGWVDKQKITFKESPHETWIFYTTFFVLATYSVMNLFVAIVVNNLQELKAAEIKAELAANPHADIIMQIDRFKKQIEAFEQMLRERPHSVQPPV